MKYYFFKRINNFICKTNITHFCFRIKTNICILNHFLYKFHNEFIRFLILSFLGSTAQLRPWPPPQNPDEFLGGFSTIFFLQGRVVSPTPNPHAGGPGLCIYISQRQGGYPF
jgi:hypothetical protein